MKFRGCYESLCYPPVTCTSQTATPNVTEIEFACRRQGFRLIPTVQGWHIGKQVAATPKT